MIRSLLLAVALAAVSTTSLAAQTNRWASLPAQIRNDALIRDADGGYLDEVRSIVEGGGDVNHRAEGMGTTPLLAAAGGGHLEIVKFLLEKGADPTVKDNWGRSAIDRARSVGATHVIRFLEGLTPQAPAAAANAPATAAAPPSTPPAPVAAQGGAPQQGAGRPAAPARAPRPAAAAGAPATAWAAFPSFREGDRVRFFVPGGWRMGTVREVGPAGVYGDRKGSIYDRKYRIADDRFGGGGDWYDHGWVASVEREPYWTGFFVGDWAVGEVMAVNARIQGAYEQTEYSYAGASEALRVMADGRYQWKQIDGKVAQGQWAPAEDGPGIVLRAGPAGRDWTLRNETNAIEENIRSIQTARLTSQGVMSVTARRPLPGAARR